MYVVHNQVHNMDESSNASPCPAVSTWNNYDKHIQSTIQLQASHRIVNLALQLTAGKQAGDTHNVQVELCGCQWSDDFIGDIFELHNINKSEVVVGKSRHDVLLEATDGRKMTSVLQRYYTRIPWIQYRIHNNVSCIVYANKSL